MNRKRILILNSVGIHLAGGDLPLKNVPFLSLMKKRFDRVTCVKPQTQSLTKVQLFQLTFTNSFDFRIFAYVEFSLSISPKNSSALGTKVLWGINLEIWFLSNQKHFDYSLRHHWFVHFLHCNDMSELVGVLWLVTNCAGETFSISKEKRRCSK